MGIGMLRRHREYPQAAGAPTEPTPFTADDKPVVEVSDDQFVKRTEVPKHVVTNVLAQQLVDKAAAKDAEQTSTE